MVFEVVLKDGNNYPTAFGGRAVFGGEQGVAFYEADDHGPGGGYDGGVVGRV